jgi:D-glycero-D-manno-heptose 1,7-bisphosphate phosphatase
MKRPAVFFDRDNTLIASDGYLGDPAQVRLIEGAASAIARARKLGYATVVVSNQSGVARGMFTEEAVHAVNAKLDELLRAENPHAVIDRHEYCPFHPEATVEGYRKECDTRKPGPGMIYNAAEALALDLSRSWLVGDAPRDIEAGKTAGCRTILFHDPSLPASPAASAESNVAPDFTASSLKEAIDYIESHDVPADEAELPTGETLPAAADAPIAHIAPANPTDAAQLPPRPPSMARTEALLEQILQEMRRQKENPVGDFSVSKLMAGIVQVLAIAVLFITYLNRAEGYAVMYLLLAVFLQVLTVALLIMGRQQP